jgi:hypothetical protein
MTIVTTVASTPLPGTTRTQPRRTGGPAQSFADDIEACGAWTISREAGADLEIRGVGAASLSIECALTVDSTSLTLAIIDGNRV